MEQNSSHLAHLAQSKQNLHDELISVTKDMRYICTKCSNHVFSFYKFQCCDCEDDICYSCYENKVIHVYENENEENDDLEKIAAEVLLFCKYCQFIRMYDEGLLHEYTYEYENDFDFEFGASEYHSDFASY